MQRERSYGLSEAKETSSRVKVLPRKSRKALNKIYLLGNSLQKPAFWCTIPSILKSHDNILSVLLLYMHVYIQLAILLKLWDQYKPVL